MIEHLSSVRMHESVDGELSAAETAAVESHLGACAVCREQYARIGETVRAVRSLPRGATPPDGVWDGIEARIVGAARRDRDEEDVPVYRLPTARPSVLRISATIPQLAAAAIVVALVSAAVVWVAMGGAPQPEASGLAAVESPRGAAARAASLDGGRYAEAAVELERILEQGRSVLTPETLVSIEQSLATIDAAITEIEAALSEDPSSDLLRRMLVSRRETRLGVLERAAAAVRAQT